MPVASELCGRCNAPAQLVCAKCKHVQYCTEECSFLHWPQHGLPCLIFCGPPGVMAAPPNAVPVDLNGFEHLAISATSAPVNQAAPVAALPQSTTPSRQPMGSNSPTHRPMGSASPGRGPTNPSVPLAAAESRELDRSERLSATEFTKVLVTSAGFQELWVNKFSNEPIVTKLHSELDNAAPRLVGCVPVVGQCYAGCYDGQWCRVRVTAVTPTLTVRYIDFGNEAPLALRDLRGLPAQFALVPAQAIRVRVAGATAKQHERFAVDSTLAVKLLSEAADGAVQVAVEGEEVVALDELPTQELPSNQFVQAPPPVSAPEIAAFQLPWDRFESVTVVKAVANGYVVSVDANQEAAYKLVLALTARAASLPRCQPRLGLAVAALYLGEWYRARVVQLSPLRVLYLDYGNTEDVEVGQIRQLPQDVCRLPAQSLTVAMAPGTSPAHLSLPADAALKVKAVGRVVNATVVVVHEDVVVVGGNGAAPCLAAVAVDVGAKQDVYFVYRGETERYVQRAASSAVLLSMNKSMASTTGNGAEFSPRDGDAVLVLFEGEWARAVVISARPVIRVRFLDYGNETVAMARDVRRMPADLQLVPAQCWKVRLSMDTSAAVSRLGDFVPFSATFLSQADSTWIIRGEIQ